MASTFEHPQKKDIMECLKDKEVKTVILYGDTGIGKTWLARDISETAISESESAIGKTETETEPETETAISKDLFYGPLWVYVNPQDDKWSVRIEESIAHQLSVLSTVEESEEDGVSKEDKRDDQQKRDDLKDEIRKKFGEMISETTTKGKHVLLILDGVTDKMNDDVIMKELKALLHLTDHVLFKVLITQRKEPVEDKTDGMKKEKEPLPEPDSSTLLQPKEEGTNGEKKEIESEPLPEPDSSTLLQPKEEGTNGEKKEEIESEPLPEPDSSTLLQPKEEGTNGEKKEEIKPEPLPEQDSSTPLQPKEERTDGGKKGEIQPEPLPEQDSSTPLRPVGKKKVKIERLSEVESSNLLKGKVTEKVRNLKRFKERSEKIAEEAEGLPAAIVVIAGALNSIAKYDSEVWTLEGAVEEAATCKKVTDDVNPLLQCGYNMMLSSCSDNDMALINCFSHSRQFFLKHGGVNYTELIAYWILEGYVGSADHIEKAYEEGHRVLMELMDFGFLKIQEDDVVNMEGMALTIPDCRRDGYERTCRRDGYERTSRLGLASAFDYGSSEGLGRVAPGISMIKTLRNRKKQRVSTLLIDGSRLCREVPEQVFQPMKGLQNLAIFNPRIISWHLWLSRMDKLHLLVLRGCDQLQQIDDIKIPESLQVLEISGTASSSKEIPDIFQNAQKLRSLNFSAVQIKSLPSSFSNLIELRWLILSGCSHLVNLPKIKEFKNLEVLDLSDAVSLKEFEDKNFSSLLVLQMLDLSCTKIHRLPFLKKLEQLTQLYLRDCDCLTRLPNLEFLSALQILDLSGATALQEIQDKSFQNKTNLKILRLSKTAIRQLPSNISNLPDLELLDLYDASSLVEIPDNIFEKMTCLRTLNLSKTKIERLPSLSKLVNLRRLLLQGCDQLVECKHLNALEKLELLDLSDCSALTVIGDESIQPSEEHSTSSLREIEAKFLEPMVQLQFLNLSGTRLKFPPISMLTNLTNLIQLSLRGFSLSESDLKVLENYKKLEVLDLSNTDISSLPSLSNLSNLRELKLRNCSRLKQLQDLNSLIHLEVLDLWGTGIEEFTELSKLTRLKQVDLPGIEGIQKLEWEMIKDLDLPDKALLPCAQCVEFKHDEKDNKIKASIVDKGKVGGIYWHRFVQKFKDIYFQSLSILEKHDHLEIIGYGDSFPDAVNEAILKAEYISLVDNKSISNLSKLSVGKTEAKLKGCQLERCTAMESFFCGEKNPETQVAEHLEILWASNLPNLKSLYNGVEVAKCFFKSLTQLYLDCCPMLKVVFPSSQLAENLEILEIKFCDKLEVIYASVDCGVKLHTLHLVELPELTSIGVPEIFPHLNMIKVRECPKLEELAVFMELGRSVEIIKYKSIEIE